MQAWLSTVSTRDFGHNQNSHKKLKSLSKDSTSLNANHVPQKLQIRVVRRLMYSSTHCKYDIR